MPLQPWYNNYTFTHKRFMCTQQTLTIGKKTPRLKGKLKTSLYAVIQCLIEKAGL